MRASVASNPGTVAGVLFRVLLFAAAASLAAYIPFKYATQLHALQGIYAFLFPLSGVLAAAGILLALKPQVACQCATPVRAGVAALAGLWLVTGLLCVPSLMASIDKSPAGGLFATFHMLAQHIFLSASVLAFAFAPHRVLDALGAAPPAKRDQHRRAAPWATAASMSRPRSSVPKGYDKSGAENGDFSSTRGSSQA